jgi:hypothetical protein
MGRILCVFARKNIRRCIGIELFEDLCEISRANALRLRGRRASIEVICTDAAVADLSEGTIYYMYNPFGPATLHGVLENIMRSLLQAPGAQKLSTTIQFMNRYLNPARGWNKSSVSRPSPVGGLHSGEIVLTSPTAASLQRLKSPTTERLAIAQLLSDKRRRP